MIRHAFVVVVLMLPITFRASALTFESHWPTSGVRVSIMQEARVMAEYCIEEHIDAQVQRGWAFAETAQEMGLSFCGGALTGLVGGLAHTDPPYRPLLPLLECKSEDRVSVSGLDGFVLAHIFRAAYQPSAPEESTIQVLLRGIWRYYECEGPAPRTNPSTIAPGWGEWEIPTSR